MLYLRRSGIGVNAAWVAGVRTPQYLTCGGPSMCWTPPITATQSIMREQQCTIVVKVIFDYVVGAVVGKYGRI